MRAYNKRRKPKHYIKKRIQVGRIAKQIIHYYRKYPYKIKVVNNLDESDLFVRGIYVFCHHPITNKVIYSHYLMMWKSLYISGHPLPIKIREKIKISLDIHINTWYHSYDEFYLDDKKHLGIVIPI